MLQSLIMAKALSFLCELNLLTVSKRLVEKRIKICFTKVLHSKTTQEVLKSTTMKSKGKSLK